MDDILIYGKTAEEHDLKLEKVMEVIDRHKIPLNKEKSEFNRDTVEYLGYQISAKGIKQTDERIKSILALTAPKTKEELQSLLGLVTYVSRFIPHLATLTDPLRRLLVKETKFSWDLIHDKTLEEIKLWMSKSEFLGYFKSGDRTQVREFEIFGNKINIL